MTGKGTDGYILGYFMVLLMALMILITAVMTMSFGYYSRIVNEKNRKQAFYTARSVAEVLAEECVNGGGQNMAAMIPDQFSPSKETEILGLPKEMGRCILRTEYDDQAARLELRVTVSLKNQEQTASAVLYWEKLLGDSGSSESRGVWRLGGYTGGNNENEEILEE